MCVAYQWLIWLTSQNSLLHEKFSNRCMAYQWLTWLTSQDLVTSQELLASNRGVAYKWLTWLTSQVLVPSWKNFQTGCAFIYGISMVDLVDFTEFTDLTKNFWICVWHISGWFGWPEVQKVVDPASLACRKYLAWQKVFEENQAINVDYNIKHILWLNSVILITT